MKRSSWLILLILLACQTLVAIPAFADIIYVGPAETYTAIQQGIDAAKSGDTVVVRDGTYPGGITLHGKEITVRSENGPRNCIIDGMQSGSGVTFQSSNAKLEGFTIQNGVADKGGGIYLYNSSPTITNCIISGNTAEYGAGIGCAYSYPTITNCAIWGNTAYYGGAIRCSYSSATIINCTLWGNTADYGGGIYCEDYSSATITNSILWNNSPQEIELADSTNNSVVNYCDIQGGYTGNANINADPLLVNAAAGDFHLQGRSPCIDAGTSAGTPSEDIDGDVRPHGVTADIGSDEYGADSLIYVGPTEPYTTIQRGIDVAKTGETVIVRDGIYSAGIDFKGKRITVKSENGPRNCIIDGGGSTQGIIFQSGETAETRLEGLTIRNCRATTDSPQGAAGGGIACYNSSPTITNCTISGNTALAGGGIYLLGSSSTFTNCTISGNTAPVCGGIDLEWGDTPTSPTFINCIISGNTATHLNSFPDSGMGGGICSFDVYATITNCTISGNTALVGGGISCADYSSLTITNSILWNDSPQEIYVIYVDGTTSPVVNYSDIKGGYTGIGNINSDPLFVNAAAGDFHLQVGSPCIDSANDDEAPATDKDGNPRPQDGNYDGVAISDMGAYETLVLAGLFNAFREPSSPDYLPNRAFRNQKGRTAAKNKIDVVIGMIGQGLYKQALQKLKNDILPKTDGCAASGAPDQNDWIIDCRYQIALYNYLSQDMLTLENIIANR